MSSDAAPPVASGRCEVVIGLLVPRPCGEAKKGDCSRCKRGYCAEHAGKGHLCTHCEKGETPPASVMTVPSDLAFKPEDLEKFEVERSGDPDNAWSDLT